MKIVNRSSIAKITTTRAVKALTSTGLEVGTTDYIQAKLAGIVFPAGYTFQESDILVEFNDKGKGQEHNFYLTINGQKTGRVYNTRYNNLQKVEKVYEYIKSVLSAEYPISGLDALLAKPRTQESAPDFAAYE